MRCTRHGLSNRLIHLALVLIIGLSISGCASSGAASGDPEAPEEYAFWPLFPDDPRIQFVRAINSSADLAPVKTSRLADIVFGPEATRSADVNKPYGVEYHDGKIYVCDIRGEAVVVFDLVKKQTRLVGVTGINRVDHPVAVTIADDGEIYVADNERGAVLVFDANERFSRMMGFSGFEPVDLAVHGDRLYASDLSNQVVQIFDRKTGEHTGSLGSVGDEDGQFRLPLGIATDPSGNLYVMDMMRCRLQKFSPDGEFLAATGESGDIAGTYARPKHIDIDEDGIIYIVDAAFQNVQMLNDEFQVLMSFGAAGEFPGAMFLPAGISVSDEGLEYFPDAIHPGFDPKRVVVVTNQFGDSKVSVYVMGELREGYTAADLNQSAAAVSAGVGASEESLRLQEQGTFELSTDQTQQEPPPNEQEPGSDR